MATVVYACFIVAFLLEVSVTSQSAGAKASGSEIVIQTGHTAEVSSVKFSPDGKSLASAGMDNTVSLWDVKTGRKLRTLMGHTGSVREVVFSPDGKKAASTGDDMKIRVWNTETGKELKVLDGHTSMVETVTLSPDGKTLASSGWDKSIKLWDFEAGRLLRSLDGHIDTVSALAFAPDGKTLASGGRDKTIKLWNTQTGSLLSSFEGHTNWILSVEFSQDGKFLASGSWDKTVRLWDLAGGRLLNSFEGHTGFVVDVAFAPDGKTLGSAGENIRIWNTETGQQIRALEGHVDGVLSVAFSPDGMVLASGGSDKSIRFWDATTGLQLRMLPGHTFSNWSVALSHDGSTLAARGPNEQVRLWNLEVGEEVQPVEHRAFTIRTLAFSPDSKILAVGGDERAVWLWSVETRQRLQILEGLRAYVLSVVFSPDGKMVAAGSFDSIVRIWDVESGRQVRTLTHSSTSVLSVAFSPDGKTLAAGGTDGILRMWDVESGGQLRSLKGDTGWFWSLAFSPDGKTLASRGPNETNYVRLWSIETGQPVNSLEGHTDLVQAVAFSPDGKILASGSKDNSIKLWDVEKGTELKSLKGHTGEIAFVTFSSDGSFLMSLSHDATIKLWNAKKGDLLATLVLLDDAKWIAATPDGRFDTNKSLDSIDGLHWVVPDDPMKPVPLDVFMRDYYEPKLLPRLLRCNAENTCEKEFKPLPYIAELNRVQPEVKIKSVSLPDANRKVKVTVEAAKGLVPRQECRMTRCETGVYDLRLFRDGQIVASYPNESEAEMIKHASDLKTPAAEKELWRRVSAVPVTKRSGCQAGAVECAAHTFEVELPKGKNVEDIQFSAYAFNEDRARSEMAVWNKNNWTEQMRAKLPKAEPVRARAYIVSVGVNASQSDNWTLKYAVKDARETRAALSERLGKQYEVVPVELISDFDEPNRRTPKDAIKANIRTVFDILSGRTVSDIGKKKIPGGDRLRKAAPDDAVFISFSSHGYADERGNFYLLPADVRKTTPGQKLPDVNSMISSDELSLWLRDVDASDIVMIIDACYAAASVSGTGFKPAPMGNRGLGQLAYDKQMRILTATREKDEAIEVQKGINQGLLTHALVHEGLTKGLADFMPKPDGKFFVTEWLEFAVVQVPKLFEQIKKGVPSDLGGKGSGYGKKKSLTSLQTPVLFDLRKDRNRDIQLLR